MSPTYYQIPFYTQLQPPKSKSLQVIYPPGPGSWGTPLPVPAGTPITYRLERQHGRWTPVPHYHINTSTPTPTPAVAVAPTIAYPITYQAYPTYTYPVATANPGYNTLHGYDRGNVPPGWPGNPVWQALPVQYPIVPVPVPVPVPQYQYQVIQPVPVQVVVPVPIQTVALVPATTTTSPASNLAPSTGTGTGNNNTQPASAPAEPSAPTPANVAGQAAASRAGANAAAADGSPGS